MSLAPEMTPEAIQARFAWARRNGLANWLWPDIPVATWRRAMIDIGTATRDVLAGRAASLTMTDADAVSLAGYTSGMGPLLGYWIAQGRIDAPPQVAALLQGHLAHNRDRNIRLVTIAREVVEQLSQAGITPTVFKGMHTAFAYFPDPGTRPLSDIDIQIPAAAIADCAPILHSMGYVPSLRMREPHMCDWTLPAQRREPHTLMYLHRDDPWSLDVQASLDRRLATGERVWLDRLAPDCPGEPWPLSPQARVLGQPLLALHLAAHVSQELRNATLLRLYELAEVLRRDSASGRLQWDAFLAGARRIGGPRFVYPALHLCALLAPGIVPDTVMTACRADAPAKLKILMRDLTPETAQPVARHSLREKFMWTRNWKGIAGQIGNDLGLDGRGVSARYILERAGNKLWLLWRRRLTA